MIALAGLAALVPRCTMIVEDLMQLSNRDLAARSLPNFPKLALWLLQDARAPQRLLASFDAWIPAMLELGQTRSGRDSLAVLITYMFRVIDPMHLERLRAKLRKLGSRSEKVAMTIAEYLHEQGRKKGRREGLKEGRKKGLEEGHKKGRKEGRKEGLKEGLKEGRITTLRSLLILKFRSLSVEYEARLHTATPKAIGQYFQRLLKADSLAAVFDD